MAAAGIAPVLIVLAELVAVVAVDDLGSVIAAAAAAVLAAGFVAGFDTDVGAVVGGGAAAGGAAAVGLRDRAETASHRALAPSSEQT